MRVYLEKSRVIRFFDRILPFGATGNDVLKRLQPNAVGFLAPAFVYHEKNDYMFNIIDSSQKHVYPPDGTPIKPLEDFIGECLWDIFSNNNTVVDDSGYDVSIGSFRGSSAFIDAYFDYFNRGRTEWRDCGDHIRFYMGTIYSSEYINPFPVYQIIFDRIRNESSDWIPDDRANNPDRLLIQAYYSIYGYYP
jgi:hypothetical protein